MGLNVHSLTDDNNADTDYDKILSVDLELAHGIHTLTNAKFPELIFAAIHIAGNQLDVN